MAELISGLRPQRIGANLEHLRGEIAAAAARAGRDPEAVEVLTAAMVRDLDTDGMCRFSVHHVVGERARA